MSRAAQYAWQTLPGVGQFDLNGLLVHGAIRAMVDHLVRTYRLSRQDAYVLCSVAVDLTISKVVDQPNWIVSAYLPLAIFA